MTLDEYIETKRITGTECGRQLGLSTGHVWKLRKRCIDPSIKVAERIQNWSDGAVTIAEMRKVS